MEEWERRVEVRVMNSSADMRYLILPRRPEGTDNMSESELAKLVTQDSVIGVGLALSPQAATA
jgi:nitrile hydratase